MAILYTSGVRVGALTIDPAGRVAQAFWTHRPARRPPAQRVLASAPLARTWPGALGLPLRRGAVAMGHRIELLPTGYGVGGAALLLTRDGHRTLVVGPTTPALRPRAAHHLVLCAPAPPQAPADWLDRVIRGPTRQRLVVPDGAAAAVVSATLEDAGVPHRVPDWLGGGDRRAPIGISTRGPGTVVDVRPQASEAWLVGFACAVGPEIVYLYGPRADAVAVDLAAAGVSTRVLHAPQQMNLGSFDVAERRPPQPGAPHRRPPVGEDEAHPDD